MPYQEHLTIPPMAALHRLALGGFVARSKTINDLDKDYRNRKIHY